MIRLLVLDVDGTLTDGGIYYDSTGNELKKFGVKDGAGLVLARTAGIRVMICTGRECEAVRRRMALCGFVACPADAAPEVKARADYQCPQRGGEGAVRGAVEHILRTDGRWYDAVKAAFHVDV